MKKGQIITISRQLPKNGLFKSYRDLQNHWNQLVAQTYINTEGNIPKFRKQQH